MKFEDLIAKCPKCGSTKVQLSNESSKHGCLYMVLFGIWYFMWLSKKRQSTKIKFAVYTIYVFCFCQMLYGESNSRRTIIFSKSGPNINVLFIFTTVQFSKSPVCFMW